MTPLAKSPTREREGRIQWWTELLEMLDAKDYESVREAIVGAMKMETRAPSSGGNEQ